MKDIKDSEIRFIGDDKPFDSKSGRLQKMQSRPSQGSGCTMYSVLIIILVLGIIGVLVFWYCASEKEASPDSVPLASPASPSEPAQYTPSSAEAEDMLNAAFEPEVFDLQPVVKPSVRTAEKMDRLLTPSHTSDSYCQVSEDAIGDIPFRIFLPLNAVPDFHVGPLSEKDPSIILALQAADIRKDNGKVVGACVYHGEIISKGLAKKGYVAIIDSQLTVGVSEHSPLFEEAIERNGHFFRQYPIVSERRIVENNLQNTSIRRAVCVRSGQYFVVETLVPVSLHDFSQMLTDLGVDNAVYLVGSQYAHGFMRDELQLLQTWGGNKFTQAKNISYLLWRKKSE